MKAIPEELLSHISNDVITIAFCFKITQQDSSVRYLTNCDQDLSIEGFTYISDPCAKIRLINYRQWNSLAYFECSLANNLITEEGIRRGLYNSAPIEIFLVNYENVSQGTAMLFSGTIGEIKLLNGMFHARLYSIMSVLSNEVGDVFSSQCRAQFCDNSCKLHAESLSFNGSVFRVLDDYTAFEDENKIGGRDYYKYGKVTFLTGRNKNLQLGVRNNTQNSVRLASRTPYPIQVGDHYSILAGCDKNFSTCATKFQNAANFRGEPHVPDPNYVYTAASITEDTHSVTHHTTTSSLPKNT